MSNLYKNEYIKLKKRYLQIKKSYIQAGSGNISIKIMEFNIENGGTLVNYDKVIKIIKLVDPDIVAIEEASGNLPDLATRLGFPYHSAQTQVISKYPIINAPPKKGEEVDNTYMFIEVVPGKIIALSNVHLPSDPYGPDVLHSGASFKHVINLEKNVRSIVLEKQLEILPKLVKKNIPVFLTGDFNTPSHLDCKSDVADNCLLWPTSLKLEKLGFHDSFREIYPDPKTKPGFTWWVDRPKVKGWNPLKKDIHDRIDFIYFAGPCKVIKSDVVGEKTSSDSSIKVSGDWPSDHRAIVSVFSVVPVNMPTLLSINTRLLNIGDILQIRYHISDKPADKIIIKLNNKVIFEHNLNKEMSGTIDYNTDTIGALDILLLYKDKIICSNRFYVKNTNDKTELMIKKVYKSGENIIVNWKNGVGNRFDWIGLKKTNENKYKLQREITNTKIEGSVTFSKNNVENWPLSSGTYEILYLIDDSYDIAARVKFQIK